MNQYIITEESICTIRDYILGAFYEGENKEKIYDLIKSEFSVMRSHPYQSVRDKVLNELRTIKQYDIIRFHEKYTLPKSWSQAKVHEIFKSGRLGISYVAAGSRCTTEKTIDLDQVRYVCRWIELRQAGEP